MSLNFPLLLVIAVAVCGLLGLIDLLFLAPRRRAAIANYQGSVTQPEMAVVERLNNVHLAGTVEELAELRQEIDGLRSEIESASAARQFRSTSVPCVLMAPVFTNGVLTD